MHGPYRPEGVFLYMEKQRPLPCYDIEKTASVTEMTGLIPFALEYDHQAESYEALYPLHRQQTDDDTPDPADAPGVCPNPEVEELLRQESLSESRK